MNSTGRKYSLHFGDNRLEFQLPEDRVQEVISIETNTVKGVSQKTFKQKISQFLQKYPSQYYLQNKKICVVIPDGTRDVPLKELLPHIKPLLVQANKLRILIATGTHDPFLEKTLQIREWLELEFGNHKEIDFDIKIHDAFYDSFVFFGTTSRGTPILLNKYLMGFDTYFLIGDLKPHYFAGYSNPLKLILPGVSAFKTVEHNHKMALDLQNHACLHPLHPDKNHQGNYLMADMLEANEVFWKNKHAFVIGIISSHGKIVEFEIGQWKSTIQKLLPRVDEFMSKPVHPADITILSCGGNPLDESLYTAQRALELTMASFKKNGKVIFLARCENGLGPKKAKENFYNLMLKPVHQLEKQLNEHYILYSHKSLRFLKLLQKLSDLYMVTELSDELLQPLGIKKISPQNLQQLIDKMLQSYNGDYTINVIDDGSKMALVRAD